MSTRRLIVGMTGASGVIYGIRLLEVLRQIPDVETHLVMSGAARRTITLETGHAVDAVEAFADHLHRPGDIAAALSSGSFRTCGMVVAPCSMKTLSGIASSYADNLLLRAADVVLKERRRLVLLVRETPLHLGHLRLMAQVTEMGAVVMPPMPAFYHRPTTIQEIVDQTVNRVLDLLEIDLDTDLFERWQGPRDGALRAGELDRGVVQATQAGDGAAWSGPSGDGAMSTGDPHRDDPPGRGAGAGKPRSIEPGQDKP
jgi:4-hydroxy-3-polyprenylbenzoate decarboxylase